MQQSSIQRGVVFLSPLDPSFTSQVRITIRDSLKGFTLIGASIKLFHNKDTLTFSLSQTNISIPWHWKDSVTFRFSYMGYHTVTKTLKINTPTQVTCKMAIKDVPIARLIVKRNKPFLIMDNDTLQVMADAVKTMNKDPLRAILNMVQGLEIDGDNLTLNGRKVAYLLVDKQKLVGSRASIALDYLEADDIVKVQFYEDDEEPDLNGHKSDKKVLVANVQTKSKPKMIKNYGADIGGKIYSKKDSLNRSMQTLSANAHGVSARVGENYTLNGTYYNSFRSTLPKRDISIPFRCELFKDKKYKFSTWDSFENHYIRLNSWEHREYLTQINGKDLVEDINECEKREDVTLKSLNTYSTSLGKNTSLNTMANFYLNKRSQLSDNIIDSKNGGELFSERRTINKDGNNERLINAKIALSHYLKKLNITLSEEISFKHSRSNLFDYNIDTIDISGTNIHIDGDGQGESNGSSGNFALGKGFGKYISGGIGLNFSYDKGDKRHFSFNALTNNIDSINTYDYKKKKSETSYFLWLKANHKKHRLEMLLRKSNSIFDQKEFLPNTNSSKLNYHTLCTSINYSYSIGTYTSLNCSIDRNQENTFSNEMLLDQLNTTNVYYLQLGNPNLKMPVSTLATLEAKHYSVKYGSFDLRIQYNMTQDNAVRTTQYFTDDTFLPEYNYTALKGATLNSWKNGDTSHDIRTNIKYGKYISAIKTNTSLTFSNDFVKEPYQYNGIDVTRKWIRNSLDFKCTTGFSSVFRAEASTSYSFSKNYVSKDAIKRQQGLTVILKTTTEVFHNLFLYADFNMRHSHYDNINYNTLNGSGRLEFLIDKKRHTFTLSVGTFWPIINANKKSEMMVFSTEYNQRTWRVSNIGEYSFSVKWELKGNR